jgi:5-methylcytosine-specific restriction protein B
LPYSKYPFSVPNNLYIIGTMNTADRSLALMDTALRRRFEFVEMMPDTTLIENYEGVDLQELLKTINQRIEVLYDREHTIGHSFLMGVDSLDKLKGAFKNKILPLLEEYFYDDWQKIRLVLNDDKAEKFYQKVEQNLFNDDEFNKTIYKRQNFDELDTLAFMNIYQQDSDKS